MLGARIKKLREKEGLTQLEFAQKLNISNKTLSKYETNKSTPDYDTLTKIANYFKVSTDYLLGKDSENTKLDDALFKLGSFTTNNKYLSFLNSIDDIDMLIKAMEKMNKETNEIDNLLDNIKTKTTIQIPILGTIRAGLPIYATENVIGWETVQADEARNGEYFYLKVTGDSMINARIYEGDLVYCRKQEDIESGEIAIILIENEATLKRVYKNNGTLILHPENPKYKPEIIDKGNVQILGKVIHVKFKP